MTSQTAQRLLSVLSIFFPFVYNNTQSLHILHIDIIYTEENVNASMTTFV